jgi:hypothetical protein
VARLLLNRTGVEAIMRTAKPARTSILVLLCVASCAGGGAPRTEPEPSGTPVGVRLSATQQAELDRLSALTAQTRALTAEQLIARRALPFRASLGYEPTSAVNFDLIQASALRLEGSELEGLAKNGFVISDKRRYPHFAYGYKAIYSQDLPVFVSADSILQAVHQSYDGILKALELEALVPELANLLRSMRGHLPAAESLSPTTRQDADLFLTLALSLLEGRAQPTVAGADEALSSALFRSATAATGSQELDLFGLEDRIVDFSQFKPRGHYAGEPRLEQYFRAMMWLGRIDFPLIHTSSSTGKPELLRRSVEAALGLRSLMDAQALARWKQIDAAVRAFVGEPDSMGPPDVDRLKSDLSLARDDLGAVSDEALAAAIVAGAYGRQRILSQIVLQAPHDGTWPLDATFLFFGQRYVFDSHVFSNVVYDRVEARPGVPWRMMPSPLDAAYAAMGNDQAVQLLAGDLRKHQYAPHLESIRGLGDEHGPGFWDGNLYNIWMGALRALSPGEDVGRDASGLPAVAQTEAWGRRILNTQLASWAQLRRDTILYAKQSYTSGVACEFPDAYVEPYPAFFAQIEKLAAAGRTVATGLPLQSGSFLGTRVRTYFERLGQVAAILREMAERQRTGLPHEPQHIAFINQAVDLNQGCGGPAGIRGWYADLFFNAGDAATFDPTIADVHTQPTDEAGAPVGRVLHVGTGYPRQIVVTVPTCMGPRAYAGVVSSYHELVTERLERLDDAAWAKRFANGAVPGDVPWMNDLIAR